MSVRVSSLWTKPGTRKRCFIHRTRNIAVSGTGNLPKRRSTRYRNGIDTLFISDRFKVAPMPKYNRSLANLRRNIAVSGTGNLPKRRSTRYRNGIDTLFISDRFKVAPMPKYHRSLANLRPQSECTSTESSNVCDRTLKG